MTLTHAVPRHSAAACGRVPRAVRRAGAALWTLFHAQALLAGNPGSIQDAAFIEDDRRRLNQRDPGKRAS
jgi:hypothetical protein